jgi:hypothetical protein
VTTSGDARLRLVEADDVKQPVSAHITAELMHVGPGDVARSERHVRPDEEQKQSRTVA